MSTGYLPARAKPHDTTADRVVAELRKRGYSVLCEPVDGHRPDIRVADPPLRWTYVDVKTSTVGRPNIAVELDSMNEYRRMNASGERVLILHVPHGCDTSIDRWTIDTPDSLCARIKGGPRRRSGNGSNDDWQLFTPGGTPFDAMFPAHLRQSEAA